MVAALLLSFGLLGAADRDAYEAAKAQAGRNPDAHVKLALWCEQHGMTAERAKHLALAVLIDPKNALARGLMGFVQYQDGWRRPVDVAAKVRADANRAAKFAEYANRRAKAPHTADGQWKLVVWCEENGLAAEARAHLWSVLRHDPKREGAWKRLGYKKHGNRWATDEQVAAEKVESETQRKADRYWRPLLTKWRKWLGDKDKRGEAQRLLETVVDPRAIPSIGTVFASGDASQQALAVRLFGQIDAPASSCALASVAIFTDVPENRTVATELLRRRDPREYAGFLVRFLRDPIKYEVRPVGGPGSPGGLFVKGKAFNVQRLYAPPPTPNIPVYPGEPVWLDGNGLPVVERGIWTPVAATVTPLYSATIPLPQFANYHPADALIAQAVNHFHMTNPNPASHFRGHNELLIKSFFPETYYNSIFINVQENRVQPVDGGQSMVPVGEIALEYQKAAVSAQQQLARDAALVDMYNRGVSDCNERIAQVLNGATGQARGAERKTWEEWWTNVKGYAYVSEPELPVPTVFEDVPLDYLPQPIPALPTYRSDGSAHTTANVFVSSSLPPSCFGAGTLVHTLRGAQAIESIRIGDQVLTQDLQTGALDYQPVLLVHHNPPSPTFLVKLAGETIVSSPFHRFWKVGRGWVMAHDLKTGDVLRMLNGPVRVEAVEEGAGQLVYNLDVANDRDFFVGRAGVLVHDNTVPDPRQAPFDAAGAAPPSASTATND